MAINQGRFVEALQFYEFFNPNVCHICKKLVITTDCSSCHMIYYCSEQHRNDHEIEHQDICDVVVNLKKQGKIWNSRVMTLEAWVKFKEENIQLVQQMLRRDLELDEKQIFLFTKSCFICHRQDEVYDVCQQCLSVNVCSDHSLTNAAHSCSQLKRALVLDRFNFEKVDRSMEIWKGYMSFDKSVVLNIKSFITKVIRRGRETSKWNHHDYIFSDDFSGPLTLCYAMKRAYLPQKDNSFVVHIVSDKAMDNRRLLVWETVLHEFGRGTMLTIVTIGLNIENESCYVDTCLICNKQSRTFKYEAHNMMYHTCNRHMLRELPDVIILFDVELRREKGATEIIKACQRQYCPVLLTAESKTKADDNVMMIREILDLPVEPLINEKNKFPSFKPYKNYKDDSVFYPNEYLIFYQNLSDPTYLIQSNSGTDV